MNNAVASAGLLLVSLGVQPAAAQSGCIDSAVSRAYDGETARFFLSFGKVPAMRVLPSLDSTMLPTGETLFRIGPIASHSWNPTTVVVARIVGRYYRLAGFREPDLRTAAGAAGITAPDSASVMSAARRLAALIDINGAETLVFPADSASSSAGAIIQAWNIARASFEPGQRFPGDSIGSAPLLKRRIARVTALSHRSGDLWYQLVYSFVFDEQGRLSDWDAATPVPFIAGRQGSN
jgi:hypothetical protein